MAHLQDPIRKQTLLSIKNGMTRRKASLITATNFGPSNPEIVDKSEQRRALIANPRGAERLFITNHVQMQSGIP